MSFPYPYYGSFPFHPPNCYFIPSFNQPALQQPNFMGPFPPSYHPLNLQNRIHSEMVPNQYSTDAVNLKIQEVGQIKTKPQQQSPSVKQNIPISTKNLSQGSNKLKIRSKNESKIRQKLGRNINSNIFRSMLKYLISDECGKQYLGKIIEKHNLKITVEGYQRMVKFHTKNMKTYVKNEEIEQFIGMGERTSSDFHLITRIMTKIYLKKIHILHSFNSKKISKSNRQLHLKFSSNLLHYLIGP